MSGQGVNLFVQDNGLGQSPIGLGNVEVIAGVSSAGTANQPTQTSSPAAITATYGYGPGPELACLIQQQTGNPIIFVKVATAGAGTNTAVTSGAANVGTSPMTITGTPIDSYYGLVTWVTGGTIGTADSKQCNVSLDAGRTVFATVNVGSATTLALTSGGVPTGLTLNFGTGTVVAGDTQAWVSQEPTWSDAGVASALQSLVSTTAAFEDIMIPGVSASGNATAMDAQATNLFNKKRFTRILCNARDAVRGGTSTESELTWISAIETDFASVSSLRVGVCAGHYNCISALSQTQFRRPLLFFAAARDAAVAIQVDLGRVKDGSLSNMVSPSAPDGFIYHDESVNPGLDGARFTSAWSIYGKPGMFIKNPNLMAPPGSDFNWLQHGHVIDGACEIAYNFWTTELSDSVRVYASGPKAGQIYGPDANDLIGRCNAMLADGLTNANAVTSATCAIPAGQNILGTSTMTVTISIVPLGYLKAINITLQFVNPAIQQIAA